MRYRRDIFSKSINIPKVNTKKTNEKIKYKIINEKKTIDKNITKNIRDDLKYIYHYDKINQIELKSDTILMQIDNKNILIDAGLGNDKFNEKQTRNFGIREESRIEESLEEIDLTINDIDIILMTHLHYDHANGLTKKIGDEYTSIYKDIPIYVSQIEWDEMRDPNIRSASTYFEMNWQPVVDQVKTFSDECDILPGLKMHHTGGHSNGHSIVIFEDGDEGFIHMADIMPTHAHSNSLWVLAYDD